MSMQKFTISVRSDVDVVLKPEAFTPEFMAEYRRSIDEAADRLADHACQIAQLVAREVIDPIDGRIGADQVVEGYGVIGRFVEKATVGAVDIDMDDLDD